MHDDRTAHHGGVGDAHTALTRRLLLTRGAVGAAAFAGVGAVTSLQTPASAAVRAVARTAKPLVVGDIDVANSLDPDGPDSVYVPNLNALAALYDPAIGQGLIRNPIGPGVTIDGATYTPMLAESWTPNGDGSTWTFKVRKGVVSTHGNELTSADFVFMLERADGLKATAAFVFSFLMKVRRIEAVDRYTFKIVCTGPSPGVLPYLATSLPQLFVLDSTELRKHMTHADPWASKWLAENPAGFGPYELTSWTPGQSMAFQYRSNYWGKTPAFTQVRYTAVPNDSNRETSLANGAIDVALTLSQQSVSSLLKGKQAEVFQFHGNYGVWLWPSEKVVPQFRNVLVRRAMAYAIPYEQIIKQVYAGRAQLPKTLFASYIPYSDGSSWDYETNAAKALSLMKQSGVQPFTVPLSYPSQDPEMGEIAAVLQAAWEPLGIRLGLTPATVADLTAKESTNRIPFFLSDWASIIAPDGIIYSAFWASTSALNHVGFSNPTFDRPIRRDRARSTRRSAPRSTGRCRRS